VSSGSVETKKLSDEEIKKVFQKLRMQTISKKSGVEGLTREIELAAPAKVPRANVNQK
jgi:hypothetical protein